MQDGGGGRKEKRSLGSIQNEFAMRFSVNQGFRYDRPEMSSLYDVIHWTKIACITLYTLNFSKFFKKVQKVSNNCNYLP